MDETSPMGDNLHSMLDTPSLTTGNSRWTRNDIIIALLVALVIVVPLTWRVSWSGAWDGDPSIHNRHAMEAVNVMVAEIHAEDGDPLRGLLQCYSDFPKMLHEIMLTGFMLIVGGFSRITFADTQLYAAWFSTLWTLFGIVMLYLCMRCYLPRKLVLLVLPIVALSGYILLYANFPRHNMPAHALAWTAWAVYLHSRLRKDHLSISRAMILGLLFGVMVPVHYSTTYWVGAVIICELILCIFDRRFGQTMLALFVLLASATVIWFAIDLYYALAVRHFPADTDWRGNIFSNSSFSFLDGMALTSENIRTRTMAYKMDQGPWWFLGGFIFHTFGTVGSVMIVLGGIVLPLKLVRIRFHKHPAEKRALVILAVGLAISILLSLTYFQNARKLMAFYPFWCILLTLGVGVTAGFTTGMLRLFISSLRNDVALRRGACRIPWLDNSPRLATVLIVLATHAIIFFPAGRKIMLARRDTGFMRQYLNQHDIDRILVLEQYQAAAMTTIQQNIKQLTISEADQFDYIVLHRLYTGAHDLPAYHNQQGESFMDQIRNIEPIVSFDNQCVLNLFWYEFPIRQEFFDTTDPLTHHRSLYRWSDVRDACRPFLKITTPSNEVPSSDSDPD